MNPQRRCQGSPCIAPAAVPGIAFVAEPRGSLAPSRSHHRRRHKHATVKVLLFDIDGTLIRAGGAGRKALNEAAFRLYGRKDAATELSLAGQTDLSNFSAAIRASTGRRGSRAEVERLHREYLRRLPRFVRRAERLGTYRLPPGIRRLLRRLSREPDIVLGLGTGNVEKGARIKLGPSGFNGYFPFGGFGCDSHDRSRLLRKAVQRARPFAAGREMEVFVIGDTPFDVAAGRKAGFKTIAVGTGFSEWDELVKARPDHLARDFRELSKWLKWFKIK